MSELFSAERYVVRRKVFKLAGGAFHVYDPQGMLVAYSEQKAFKLKEDIRVYADESKTRELLVIQARQVIDFSAAYDVTDSTTRAKVGALRRRGGRSILRDEWKVLDPSDAEVGTIIEDSMGWALFRRMLTNLVPQKYDVFFPDVTTGQKIANMDQQFNPFVYKLDVDLSTDPAKRFDRRLAVSAAILLAAIEGRQN
ncbi:MAG: hypothetical protein LLG08_02290 [Actinomycetia bacterium]|nr:hypothetical protein [Actinomycetes bacterium]